MKGTTEILMLYFETPVHAGTGAAVGAIDLPIQRERITEWPMINSSSIKGALRAAFEEQLGDGNRKNGSNHETVRLLFGAEEKPDTEGSAGALSFGDARLLLFPVSSSLAPFVWVTCPSVLRRYQRDLVRLSKETQPSPLKDIPKIESGKTLGSTRIEGSVILEDLAMEPQGPWDQAWQIFQPFFENTTKLSEFILLISDGDFHFLAKTATEIQPRIALNDETKTTTNGGNLWYQELLPSESLMYVPVVSMMERADRKCEDLRKPEGVMHSFTENLPPYVQIGGDETLGRGWARVSTF